ncbi:uncharacterized protein PG998_001533 [Apiospora kogelbergensis]|uniref:Uncharacterized protein n=1 Tax=Apiospora kogelbergensis TaxID=1337665 RepID=A0AAW0QSX3_9PEZI
MYRYIIALAIAASSIPSGVAQIATQFQSPSIAFSSSDDCSNAGTASSMVAGSCTAIPKDLLTGSPSQGMNITYPIDNVDLNCPLTFYADGLCAETAYAMPYSGSVECVSVSNYGSVMAKCSNILTGATYTAPANSS